MASGDEADLWPNQTCVLNVHSGPIFRLYLSSPRIFVANHAIANELCDEKRFRKSVTGALEQVRNAAKDGLFTAYPGEHNWEIAHRILMPAFGPLSIRGMYDGK
jgi:cytochrome P450/NADPH-cytochrome P450 reductase